MQDLPRHSFPLCEANAIRALAFDCDGVLLDSGRTYYLAYEQVLREAGALVSPREVYLREGQPTPDVLRAILETRGLSCDPAAIRAMVERRREYQSEIGGRDFFPTAWLLLARLRQAGYKIAMVTGSSRKSIDTILTPELRLALDAVITADDVEHPKPAPQPFEYAARAMGVGTAHCLAIENAPYGVQSAKTAGCPVIAMCTTLSAEDLREADWIVQDHAGLEALLQTAASPRGVPCAESGPSEKRDR